MASYMERQLDDNRQRINRRGDELDQVDRDEYGRRGNLEDNYRERGDDIFNRYLNEGGYSPEEASLINDQNIGGLGYTGDEYNDQFLSAGEQAGITGNARSFMDRFQPEQSNRVFEAGANNRRGALNRLRTEQDRGINTIGESIGDDLQMDSQYGGRLRDAVSAGGSTQRGVINEGGSAQRGIVNRLTGQLDGTVDPGLRASNEYLSNMRVSPREQQEIEQSGSGAIRRQTEGLTDQVIRRASASGNSNPLAVSSALGRMRAQSANDIAEAGLKGKLAASSAMRQAEESREGRRMQGDTAYSDAGYRASTGAADRGLDTERGQQQARLGVEQGQADRNVDVEQNLENTRLGAARDVSNRRAGYGQAQADAGYRAGQTDLSNEADIAQGSSEMDRYNQRTAMDNERGAEQEESDRAGTVAGNRQAASRYGSEQRYDRGMGVAGYRQRAGSALSEARRADRDTGAGYFERQQRTQQQGRDNAAGRRQATYGTQTGGNATNANQVMENDQNSSLFNKFIKVGNMAANAGKAVAGFRK